MRKITLKRDSELITYCKSIACNFGRPENRVLMTSRRVPVASQLVGVASKVVPVASRQVLIGSEVASIISFAPSFRYCNIELLGFGLLEF
jgi:hypothetical protein